MIMKIKVDTKGRVVIPQSVREKMGITEGTLISVEEREDGILLRPIHEKRKTIEDFYSLEMKRTGKPEWATPKEIKSIWE